MCGFFGKTNFNSNVSFEKFKESLDLIKYRGIDEYGYYFDELVSFGHRRLAVIDKINGKQPFIYNDLKMVYNGEIYNLEELRDDLINKGYTFLGYSDTEVLIKGYNEYKLDILNRINGIFSFAIIDGKKLILARDRFGVKPLYYAIYNNDIIFSSEMKSIIHYTDYRDVSINGLRRLFGISPMMEESNTIYDNIFQLPKASYLIFDGNIQINKYWYLEAKPCNLSYEEACRRVRELVEDSIKIQSRADVSVGCFLSGGLDSSVVYQILKNNVSNLNSYCLDYEDNINDYVSDEFNISKDNEYIKYLNPLNHHDIIISNEDLFNHLKDSLIARDYPAMADIDSSMWYLCQKIKENDTVALSGECADEIFGGYPWYFKTYDSFPWIRNIDTKESLLNIDLGLNEYIKNLYDSAIKDVSYLDSDSDEMKKKRLSMSININYFMQNMLERKDRMSMAHSLEIRVPYCDYRIVEFMYNVNQTYLNKTMEKSILRDAFKDLLPNEIYSRKKSPYPKTHSHKYFEIIKNKVNELIDSNESIINVLFKKEKLKELENIDFKPFYGQLMTLQSFYGFLYQLDYWYKEYRIRFHL